MPQLQAFIDTCHKIICDFIRGRGHKVPDKHVSAHMGKLGLKKLCEAPWTRWDVAGPLAIKVGEIVGSFCKTGSRRSSSNGSGPKPGRR